MIKEGSMNGIFAGFASEGFNLFFQSFDGMLKAEQKSKNK